MNVAICPSCAKAIAQIQVVDVPLVSSHQERWQGKAYLCPDCQKILSVHVNPFFVNADLVAQVEALLKKMFDERLPKKP